MTSNISTDNLASLETSHRWQELLEASNKYLAQGPRDMSIGYYYQGIASHELKQYSKAEDSFNKAIDINDKNALLYNAKGLLFKDQRKFAEAIKEFSKAIDVDSDILNPQINKAQTLSIQGKNDQALIIYNSLLEKNQNLVPVLIFKAECLKDLGRNEEAYATYDDALKLEPDAADLVFNKGNVYAQEGKHNQAIECYRKAAQLDPTFSDPYYHLGMIYQKQSKFDDAIANYKLALNKGSLSPLSHSALGLAYQKQGNSLEAEKAFDDGINKFPRSPFGLYNYAISKLGVGKISESTSLFDRAIMSLDEPEWSKLQLKRDLHDQETELNRVSEALPKKLFNSQQVVINYPALVENLEVRRENEQDIISNLTTLKKRILSLDNECKERKTLDDNLINLQVKNPALHEYVVNFLSFQNNFLSNSNLKVPKENHTLSTVNLLRNTRELPNLMSHTCGLQGAELIIKATDSSISKLNFLNKAEKLVLLQKKGVDSDETLYKMATTLVKNNQSMSAKDAEIKSYDSNEYHKGLIDKIIKAFPKTKSDISNPSTAVAIKDFVLLNNYMLVNSETSDFANKNYEQNFESAYLSRIYEKKSEQNLTTSAENFQSFKGGKGDGNYEINITFDNKTKAISTSTFFVQVYLGLSDSMDELKKQPPSQLKEIFKSEKMELKANNVFTFNFEKTFLAGKKIDKAFLKVIVWKSKSDQSTKQKGEGWVSLQTIAGKSAKLMQIKQDKVFSSKIIFVFIQARNLD